MLRQGLNSICLFDFDLCTCGLDLFLDIIRLLLGHAFLDRFGRAFYERFRLRKAEPRNRAPYLFDHCNLVCAHFGQDHVKRGLFLGCWSSSGRRSRAGSRRNRYLRRGADTPFFLKLLDQSCNLQNRKVAELLYYLICICHFVFFLQLPPPKAFEELKPVATSSDNFVLCCICSTGEMPAVQNSCRRRTLLFSFRIQ